MVLDYKDITLIKKTVNSIIYLVIKDNRLYVKKLMEKDNGMSSGYQQIINLCHKNIACVFEVETNGDQLIIIQQYVSGSTIEEELWKKGSLDKDETLKIMLQLCDGISFIHGNDTVHLVHRDIKPSNVMISDDGVVKLVDLGTVRRMKPDTYQDTEILGTRGFASPEQFGFAQTNEQADIYAMGAMMYQMLSGKDIRAGISIPEQMKLDAKNITYGLKRIICKCTELDPKRRYPSVKMLKSDLHRELLGFPTILLLGFRSAAWWKAMISTAFLTIFVPNLIWFHYSAPYFRNLFTAFLILAIPYTAVTNIFYVMDIFPKYACSLLARRIYILAAIAVSLVILYFEDFQYIDFYNYFF